MGGSADQFCVPECSSTLVLSGVPCYQSIPDSLQMLTMCIFKIKCRDFSKYHCFSLEASLISQLQNETPPRKLNAGETADLSVTDRTEMNEVQC